MDKAVEEKFLNVFGLPKRQIQKYENHFNKDILPAISRHFLSHLVTTIEELINSKKKEAFLEQIKRVIEKKNPEYDYVMLEKNINLKIFRLFSIILVPVKSGKVKARTNVFRGGYGVMITYWDRLLPEQIRILIAHELGHVANKFLFDNSGTSSEDGLASLFGYIALCDRNEFYKKRAKPFTREHDLQIYNDIANICHKKDM